MPLRWTLFRIVCILQMIGASIYCIKAIIDLIRFGNIAELMRVLLFGFMFMLTICAVNVLNNNYPDTPVTGKQKTNFNRLFLINFMFLVFMFGIIFAEYTFLTGLADVLHQPGIFRLPFQLFIPLLVSILMLVLQLVVLYGMYVLRRELYENFSRREFEFEKADKG